jgi:SAM-dependent methyltransferase
MEPFSPGVILAVYAEPLLEGRRVVVFGDATSSLAAELVERGARAVHVYDPEPSRAAVAAGRNRSKQISVVPLDEADIAVRDGAFDVAIVEDLSTARDPAALLKRVRRALSARGAAVIASPSPDTKLALLPRTSVTHGSAPLGYYALYDTVSAEFPEVRMLGQTPFVGYAVVDFAPEGEPEVSIDSGLVPGGAEEPEWFIALAGREAVECGAFSVVQLPASRVLSAGVDTKIAEELRAARAAEAHLIDRVATLEAEAATARAKQDEPRPDLSRELVSSLELALEKKEARLSELQARATAADARADQASEALEKRLGAFASEKAELEKRLGALTSEKAELEKRLGALTSEKTQASKQLSALAAEKTALATQLARRDAEKADALRELAARDAPLRKVEGAGRPVPAGALDDVGPLEAGLLDTGLLEAGLKERGERVRKLEADLREAERVGAELLRELRNARNGKPAPEGGVPKEVEPLMQKNARLMADLEAAGWTIQELEGRLSGATGAAR